MPLTFGWGCGFTFLVKQRPSQLGKRNGFCQWPDTITQLQEHGLLAYLLAIDSSRTSRMIARLHSMAESICTTSLLRTKHGAHLTPTRPMRSCCVTHGLATVMLRGLHVTGIQRRAGGRASSGQAKRSIPTSGLWCAAMSLVVAKDQRAQRLRIQKTENPTVLDFPLSLFATWFARRFDSATCWALLVGTALSAGRWVECRCWSGRLRFRIA